VAIRGKPPTGFTQKERLRKQVIDVEVEKALGIWGVFERAAAHSIMAVFDAVGYKILFDATNACPYETGMLRRSARGDVQLGSGGLKNILYVSETDEEGYFEIKRRPITQQSSLTKHIAARGSGRMRLSFSFSRRNERGENIAVWTHEELLPFSVRKRRGEYEEKTGRSPIYFATKPGTGPKYLENAIAKYHNEIRSDIKRILQTLAKRSTDAYWAMPKAKTPQQAVRKVERASYQDVERYRAQKYAEAGILIPRKQARMELKGIKPKRVRRKSRKRDTRGRFTS
jgi:hypothetical protein